MKCRCNAEANCRTWDSRTHKWAAMSCCCMTARLEISSEDPLWAAQLLELLFSLSEGVIPTVSMIIWSNECNTQQAHCSFMKLCAICSVWKVKEMLRNFTVLDQVMFSSRGRAASSHAMQIISRCGVQTHIFTKIPTKPCDQTQKRARKNWPVWLLELHARTASTSNSAAGPHSAFSEHLQQINNFPETKQRS